MSTQKNRGLSTRTTFNRRLALAITLFVVGATCFAGGLRGMTSAWAADAMALEVSGATLTWALNDESGGGAYFGGCNFLSAGEAGNTGSSRQWTDADRFYKAADGNVSIHKPSARGDEVAPTWATRCQDRNGKAVTVPAGNFNENQVKISNGTGWADVETNTARLAWKGSFTVAYYGGMTYWSASDLVLRVAKNGSATLDATLSGYGASMENAKVWEKLASVKNVRMANLSGVRVTEAGLESTEESADLAVAYLGVSVTSLGDAQTQASDSEHFGSFPQSFIDFQLKTGQGPYWYSSGGAADAKKVAKPIQVNSFKLGKDVLAVDSDSDSPTTNPTPKPTPTPTPKPTPSKPSTGGETVTDSFAVTGAQLRWGMSPETNSGTFFGGCNFLSAGKAGNAGGSKVWTEKDGFYAGSAGNVRIEKPGSDGVYRTASWATKCLDSSGKAVTTSSTSSTTESQVVIDKGVGTVNPAQRTAQIQWQGTYSVAFYGGMTYWSVTDPTLTVKNGTGTLTATASGFAADMDDPTKWAPVKEQKITLATLNDVNLSRSTGFTSTPAYLGVDVSAVKGASQAEKSAQNKDWWGSYPADFVRFQVASGQNAYWYTSGGARDKHKVPTALAVTYTAPKSPVVVPPKDTGDKTTSGNPTTPKNPIKAPPTTPATPRVIPQVTAKPSTVNPSPSQVVEPQQWPQTAGAPVSVVAQPVSAASPEVVALKNNIRTADDVGLLAAGGMLLTAAGMLLVPRARH